MHIKNRIKKMETENNRQFNKWLSDLSDEQLQSIAGDNDAFSYWLKTLSDGEVETIRYDKPGADALLSKFYEHQKQAQKN